MANEFNRNIQDANLTLTKALPATSSNNLSDALDLGAIAPRLENAEFEITIPAMPLHVTSGNTVTIKLQDSADNSSYADVDPLHQTTIIGVVSTGSVGKVLRFRLPPNVRRYVKFYQSTGGTDTLTSYSITYKLLV